jgi:outer membrane beta-barrel protein
VEATALWLSTKQKAVVDDLQSDRLITTAALVTPKSYYGLDIKWSPIYGKIGWMNRKIVPFDFYFSVGGGLTSTNQSTNPPTLHLGGGQIFAISKSMAARWDISWYAYKSDTSVTGQVGGTYTNLHATIGMSFFFPEADYR